MSDIKEDDIQKRAYSIWEAAGRPDGSHESHWHQAREELLTSTKFHAPETRKPEIKVRKAAARKPAAGKTTDAAETVVAPATIKVRGKKSAAAATNGASK